jgi:hypothetical protein
MKALKTLVAGIFCFVALAVFIGAVQHTYTPASPPADSAPIVNAYKDTPGNREIQREARVEFAKRFDQKMLDAGIESTTSARGAKNTTLYIKYALAGRVTANALGNKLDFAELKTYGFKKVVFTNEFDGELGHTFTWKVE